MVEVAEEQGVGDEARLVADDHRLLAEPLGERLDVLSKTSSAVITVRMTSTNCCTGAGLKKCMPTTRLGFDVATAISVTGSDEVFVARTASGETTASTLPSASLEVEVLGHRLDNGSAVREVGEVGGVGDPCVERVVLLLGDLLAGERPCRAAPEDGPAVLDPRLVDLDGDHVDPVPGEHLHDARTHRPGRSHPHW